jgi:hypothetical protein
MKAYELAALLMEHPDADVQALHDDTRDCEIRSVEYFPQDYRGMPVFFLNDH